MTDETTTRTSLRSVALIVVGVAVVGAFAAVAIGPAAADHTDYENGDYTVVLPHDSDHLPGDQNEGNASMQNFAQSGDGMREAGAPNGFETLEYLETGAPEIDYSGCSSANTAVFGVDRGNNNTGTQTDTDLLKHMKESRFKEHKIEVEFYSEDDLGGNPTYLNPEDAIVSVQGAGSSGGPCFTMPTEPGWYQTNGLVRGTTEDGETVEVTSESHYFPICEGCHDEETAREKLGPKPSEDGDTTDDGDDESTPTPTPTATAQDDSGGEGDGEASATPTASDSTDDTTDETTDATGDTADTTDDTTDDGGEQTSDDQTDDEQNGAAGQNDTGGNGSAGQSDATPTPGGGPGFGPAVAILALLGAALLSMRRR